MMTTTTDIHSRLSDLCNTTLSENTFVNDPDADYVSSDCVITVLHPFKLVIDGVDFATGEGANLEIVGEGDAELKIKKSEIYVDGDFVISFMFGKVKLADNGDSVRVLGLFVIETMGGEIDIDGNHIVVYLQDFEIEGAGGDVTVEDNHIVVAGFMEIQQEAGGRVQVEENYLTVVGNLVVESCGPGDVAFFENGLNITGCLEVESDAECGGSALAGKVDVQDNDVFAVGLGAEISSKNSDLSLGECVAENNFGVDAGLLNGECLRSDACLLEVP